MLLVTGFTGHTGKWFHQRLVEENYTGQIKYITRKTDSPLDNSPLNLEKFIGDLDDLDLLTKNMVGVETVLHIASINRTENVMKAALANKVKWIICVHTTGRFSKFKSASEGYIKIEDGVLKKRDLIDITIVRPTMIYGSSRDENMYKLVRFLDKSKVFPLFGEGKNLMQPVHARDLGNAYYDILMNQDITRNKEYNLSGKYPIEYQNIIKAVAKALDKKVFLIKLPMWFSIQSAKLYNSLFSNALINVEQVLRMQEDKDFDHELAAKDFGYSPINFEEGIKDEVKEYLEKKK